MRLIFVAALVGMLVSGCIGASETSTSTTDETPVTRMVPADIWDNKTVTASFDPTNLAGEPVCTSPTAQCFRYPFTLTENSTRMEATLVWSTPANDFDFYVFQDGAAVVNGANDVTGGPTASESISTDLGKGEYEIVVVGWGVAQDTYALHATFS